MAEETAAYTANGEPKYPFVGRIVEAYYTNADLTEIDIIHNYDVPDDGAHTNGGKEGTTVFSVSVDETDERFLALLQEFSYESLDECTRNRNEAFREQFREAFRDYAQRNQAEIFEEVIVKKEVEDGPLDLIFDYDSENEVHKDILFRLKLKMFEQEVVQKSKKKKAKSDIRKAETLGEALKAYYQFL